MSFYSRRANEGGSLITFLVVGVILAALVVGGIYTISRRDHNPQPTPATSTKPSPSKSVAVSNSPKHTPSKSPKASTPASPTPKVPKTQTSSPKAPLPATGPTEDMVGISMFAVLVGTMIAYVRSTREWRLARQVD